MFKGDRETLGWPQEPVVPMQEERDQRQHQDPEKYLVVDRALTVTRRVRDQLERAGVPPDRIHEAFTADGALRLFERHRPAVTILSMDLPDMGGHEVAKDMWSLDDDAEIVVHSALPARDRRVRQTLSEGATAALRKPMGERETSELVGRVAASRASATAETPDGQDDREAEAVAAGPDGSAGPDPPVGGSRRRGQDPGAGDRFPPYSSSGT